MKTINNLIKDSAAKIKHLQTSILDCEVLLSFVLNKPREYLLAHPDEEVKAGNIARFDGLIARRATDEPVAYLIQNKEFYGRNFYVDKQVHIPRPGTEDLIDIVLSVIARSEPYSANDAAIPSLARAQQEQFNGIIADIGTGSGCIAITLALEFPNAKIIATDIFQDALDVGQHNADKLGVKNRITFLKGNLLSPLAKKADIIVANLPYGWPQAIQSPKYEAWPQATRSSPKASEGWTDDTEVFFQPRASYDGGKDGLELIAKLITGLDAHLVKNGQCFLEFDPRQTESMAQLAKDNNYGISIKKDTANFDRVAILTKIQNQP